MIALRNERQHVVPRWLSYDDAVGSGELDKTRKQDAESVPHDNSFDSDFETFQKSPAILLASDLMGRALVLEDSKRAAVLACHILDDGKSPEVTLRVARSILGVEKRLNLVEGFREKVGSLKKRLAQFPRNPIAWTELARVYTILNEDDKARLAIITALGLAPSDRYCVRAAARFYMHLHDKESAYLLFRNRSERLRDPWILATAASTAIWAGKPSMLPKKAQIAKLLDSRSLEYSELIEAYAMEEFSNGAERLAKKAVRAALRTPSVNAVSHAEWFTRNCLPGLQDAVKPHASISRAAQAHELFFQEGNVRGALAVSEEWILEEPYSSAPFVHASYLASVAQDYTKAVSIAEEAAERKISNLPLLNNAAFSLIHVDKMQEARALLDKILPKENDNDNSNYSVLATNGLYLIKSGEVIQGRLAYEMATESAHRVDPKAANRVKLHLFLALLQNGHDISKSEIASFNAIDKDSRDIPERILVLQIKELRQALADKQLPEKTM